MEGRERVAEETIVPSKNDKDDPGAGNMEKTENTVSENSRMYTITTIIRALEILIVVLLLMITIALILVRKKKILSNTAAVLLFGLFTTYIFILSVDMFRRVNGGIVSDTTMFLVGVLGFFLFVIAAEGIYRGTYKSLNIKRSKSFVLGMIALCTLEALLFLIDVGITILNWRNAAMRVDKCPETDDDTLYKPGDNLALRSAWIADPHVLKDNVRDVTTSISDYQRSSHPDLTNLHKFRRIGVGHRREYMDRPVSAQPAIPSRVVEAQTEPPQKKIVSDVESLVIADTKEEPVQTMPKCPVCASNWNPQGNRRADNFGLCPTFLHLTQGLGMCNCSHPISPVLRPSPAELPAAETSETELRVTTKRPRMSGSEQNTR